MRLFEVDQGSVRDVLAVLKGLANKGQKSSTIPFPAVMNILRPFGLGISTPDGLIALKNKVDPNGAVIKDISNDGSIALNTDVEDPNQQPKDQEKSAGPNVDAMASRGAKKLQPDI
jgi:hypothetical protein